MAGEPGKPNKLGLPPNLHIRRSSDLWGLGCILYELLVGK